MPDPSKSVQAPQSLSDRVATEAHRLKPAYKAYKTVADPLKNYNYARQQFVDKGLIPGEDRFDLFFAKFKKVDKWIKTAERVRKLLVPEERYGLILKDAVEEALKLIAKVLNVSERAFLSHPYYTYHAAHMDILLACIGAVTKVDKAEENLKQAGQLASEIQDQANRVDSAFDPAKDSDVRQLDGWYTWWDIYKRSLRDATLNRTVNVTESELRDVDYALGQAARLNEKVQRSAETILEYWVMIQTDVCNVNAAITRYEKSIEEIKKSNIFGNVFGQASEKRRLERQVYDEIDNKGDPNADPEKATHRAVRKVEVLMDKWMNIADRANEGRRLLQ
jgi:tetratricopeptide (TPR) repeat protein